MKHVKMLALAAVAAGALMAFIGAGTASATVICSTTASPCPAGQDWAVGTVVDFSLAPGTSFSMTTTTGSALDTCTTSTLKGKISNTGGSTSTATELIEELTWGNCTFPTKTIKNGGLEVHRIAGTSNGTMTADGTLEMTFNEPFGTCVYKFENGISLGEITEGKPAKFIVNAVARITGGVFCPTSAIWSAEYTLTAPSTTLSVSDS